MLQTSIPISCRNLDGDLVGLCIVFLTFDRSLIGKTREALTSFNRTLSRTSSRALTRTPF